jgi:putative nucleotidyltransferase with HDIG domain
MRIVPVNELVEGDQLGRGLYTSEGRLLLKQGISLNHRLIEGIKRLGHSYIFVEMTAQQSSMAEYDTKKSLFYLTESILQQLFKSILTTSPFPIKPLLDWADHVTAIVADEPDLTISCQDLAPGGMELITHSLNVCFLSLLTAKALGYTNAQLIDVAIGSLLHDIGHVIPYDNTLLINHPIIGYDLLKKQRGIPDSVLKIVLQHHEQIDGRGFPNGLSYFQLLEASQICGLASDFDYFMNDSTMTRLPSEGIDMVMSKIDTAYSYGVVRAFLIAFQPYPVGTQVIMTGGLSGRVQSINKANACRPVVRLDNSDSLIDLMSHMTFRIEKAVFK